jgi:hypothetical protein
MGESRASSLIATSDNATASSSSNVSGSSSAVGSADRYLRSVECTLLIADLLRRCQAPIRASVVSMLSDMLFQHASNVETWRAGPGVVGTLELLRLAPELLPALLVMLNQLLKRATIEEIEPIVNFLLADQELHADPSSGSAPAVSLDPSHNQQPVQYAFVREKIAVSELLRVMFMTRPDMLLKWHAHMSSPAAYTLLLPRPASMTSPSNASSSSSSAKSTPERASHATSASSAVSASAAALAALSSVQPFAGFFLLLDSRVEVIRLDCLKLLCMLLGLDGGKLKPAFIKCGGFEIVEAILSKHYGGGGASSFASSSAFAILSHQHHCHQSPPSLILCETLLRLAVSMYRCDASSQLADKKLGGEEDQVDYSRHTLVHPEALCVLLRLLGAYGPMHTSPSAAHGGSSLHVHVVQQLDLMLCERPENMARAWEPAAGGAASAGPGGASAFDILPLLRGYLLAVRFGSGSGGARVPDSVWLEGRLAPDAAASAAMSNSGDASESSSSSSSHVPSSPIPTPESTATLLAPLLLLGHAHPAERERVLTKCGALLHRLLWFDLCHTQRDSRCLAQVCVDQTNFNSSSNQCQPCLF